MISRWDHWMECLPRLVSPAVGLGVWHPLATRALNRSAWAKFAKASGAAGARWARLAGLENAAERLEKAAKTSQEGQLYLAESMLYERPAAALKRLKRAGGHPAAVLYEAAALLLLKRWRAAEKRLASIKGSKSTLALAAFLSASAALRRGDAAQALLLLSRAERLGFDCAALHWLKAFAYQARGEKSRMRRAVDEAFRRYSEVDPLDAMLGSALRKESALFAAPSSYTMELLDRAVEKSGERAWALAVRAETRRAPQFLQYQKAVSDLEEAARLAPKAGWIFAKLGRAYINVERLEDSLAALEKAVKLEPRAGWIRAWRGECRRRLRKPGALADLDLAVRWAPDYPFSRAWRGAALRQAGRLEEAAAELEASLLIEPDYEWSSSELFEVRKAQERWPEAARLITRAFETDPKFTWSRSGKAALGELERAARSSPGDCDVLAWRAWAFGAEGRAEHALKSMGSARASTAFASYVLGELEAHAGRKAAARRHLDRAVALKPAGPYLAARGVLRCAQGDLAGAAADLEAAVRLNDTTARWRTALAVAYAGQKRWKESLKNLELALGICPNFPQAETLKEQVKRLSRGAAA